MAQVIHIFGAAGSGTTTLGKAICDAAGFFHMDTDDYFWLPTDPKFTQKRPADQRVSRMKEDIALHGNVVISGSLTDWGDVLIPDFTLAIRLEMDPETRISRLRKREYERFGDRILPGGDMRLQHEEFIRWAERYDTAGPEVRSRQKHDIWQKQLVCPLLQLDGGDRVEVNLQKVLEMVQEKG